MSSSPRVPVIVGVGQVNERPRAGEPGSSPVDLMEAAARSALQDAGSGWLERLDDLRLVRQVSFPEITDAPERLAGRLALSSAQLSETDMPGGTSAVRLLNSAANDIAAGRSRAVLVAGGEAFRTQRPQSDSNAFADSVNRFSQPDPLQLKYGLVTPTEIYPLYENATRAAWGQTLAEGNQESALIWSEMSKMAAQNPAAAIRREVEPAEILTISGLNRPIAFPYSKLMVANNAVSQAAAFIVTSLDEALAAGVSEERLIYVGRGAAAHECRNPLLRESYEFSRSMEVSLANALTANGLTSDDLNYVELYSCFPCIPKMARRIIGWPLESPVSVYGGLTFGGAPVGNAMGHAIVRMTDVLRETAGIGLVFGNSGFATSNHSIVLSRSHENIGSAPWDYDVQAQLTPSQAVLLDSYEGPGEIETYTVVYDRSGAPDYGVIVGRTPRLQRFLCRVPRSDERLIRFLTDGHAEPVGARGAASIDSDGYTLWQPS